MTKRSASAELARCVPPQNSMEYCRHLAIGGIGEQILDRHADGDDADHRRIFFAEDGAQAVDLQRLFLRGDFGIDRQLLRRCSSLTSVSTLAISSSVRALPCEKSKRSFSGSTSEPFCCTCIAEDFAQGPVGQVRGGVIFFGAVAAAGDAWR